MGCLAPYDIRLKETQVRNSAGGLSQVARVPCGKCAECKRMRVDHWVFRLRQEQKVSHCTHFLTLTYANENVPMSKNGFMTLDRKEFPDFMKRLRYYQSEAIPDTPPIKYYAVGEYGDQFQRPHYHAIIFNAHEPSIAKAWKLGIYEADPDVNSRNIAYCMKYLDKPFKFKHARDDRVRPFSLMSKGLGKSYLDDPQNMKFHQADITRNYVLVPFAGKWKKVSLPRYYREKIYTPKERETVRLWLEDKRIRDLQDEYYTARAKNRLLTVEQFLKFKADAVQGAQARFEKRLRQQTRELQDYEKDKKDENTTNLLENLDKT